MENNNSKKSHLTTISLIVLIAISGFVLYHYYNKSSGDKGILDTVKEKAGAVVEEGKNVVEKTTEVVEETTENVVDEVKEKAGAVVEEGKNVVEKTTEVVEETTENVVDEVKEKAEEVKEEIDGSSGTKNNIEKPKAGELKSPA